jgi:hypothetical protein
VSFLYPAFLVGALAIALPIALHLLRRDVAPEVRFSAVRLLKRSPVERSRRRRLRDLLLLAARVTALLLLATAFARPFAPGAASAMLPLRIVAIDRSYSMAAPGVFERALEMARAAVDEAGFGERVAVIAFDERATVLAQPGGPAEARAALDALRPGEGATRYAAALTQAAELASSAGGRLVLITDLQRAGWEGESSVRLPAPLEVEVREVGAPAANLALVHADVTDDGRIASSIRNVSAAARSGVVTLTRDGREIGRAEYEAAPHQTVEVDISATPGPGPLTAAIVDDTGYPADNVRHLLVGDAAEPTVLVITSTDASGFYLQRALEAAEGSGLGPLRPRMVAAGDLTGERAKGIGEHRAVVLLSTRNLDRAAREGLAGFVRSGGGLVVAASPDVDPGVLASIFGWPAAGFAPAAPRPASLTATDVRHPVFQPFSGFAANLGAVRFTRTWRITGGEWYAAARFDDGAPALVERTEGQGRVALFASDLDRRWNDFPLHPAFVPVVAELLRHVSSSAPPADVFVVGKVPAGFPATAGVHRLESGRVVAINVDTRESSTTAMTEDEFAAMIQPSEALPSATVQAQDVQTEERQSLWQYGLLLMLGVLVVESFVGRRT